MNLIDSDGLDFKDVRDRRVWWLRRCLEVGGYVDTLDRLMQAALNADSRDADALAFAWNRASDSLHDFVVNLVRNGGLLMLTWSEDGEERDSPKKPARRSASRNRTARAVKGGGDRASIGASDRNATGDLFKDGGC
jgi:hypothetical protein